MGYLYPTIPATGSINILTSPSGAKIFLDGTDTGHITPYTLTNISMETHIIKLTLSSYIDYFKIIEVKANQTTILNINLTPTPILPTVLTGITVLPSTMNLMVGESQTIGSVTAYYFDSSSANIALINCDYSSSNTSCATVNSSGTITAAADGIVTITVFYSEGGITRTDLVEVTVSSVAQNETVYRAFLVGVGDYIFDNENNLSAPPYDVDRMAYTLSKCSFGPSNTPFSDIWPLKDHSATKSAILQGIASVFSGADNNDISYFYFSGHGASLENISYLCPADLTPSANSAISVNELENALSAIPGTKVVFIDSCNSGGFIGNGKGEKTKISKEELESFNDDLINVFYQAQSKALLTSNQYKVLTSCHYYQESYEIDPFESEPFGLFTMALCTGGGYYGNYPADTNSDHKVSLDEAYLYVKDWVRNYFGYLQQDVQVSPNNSTFAIMEY
jgi:hypothetical protein